jgi:hypothetical protein
MKLKHVFILCLCLFFVSPKAQSHEYYREQIKQAETSEEVCEQLLETTKTWEDHKISPEMLAFKGMVNMVWCKYAGAFSKFKYFRIGKRHIEDAVRLKPNSLEVRFCRLACQEKTPSFLGYKNNITEDKAFVARALKEEKDADLKRRIEVFFKKNKISLTP